ncbi:hypothetical protein NOCARDAX2BIS_140071 [Nocardioides sp. AX2bis]|nr:hypothetical protein NOCARDAX2BIS_140071 [Nocardioides sp. AX2bis]
MAGVQRISLISQAGSVLPGSRGTSLRRHAQPRQREAVPSIRWCHTADTQTVPIGSWVCRFMPCQGDCTASVLRHNGSDVGARTRGNRRSEL